MNAADQAYLTLHDEILDGQIAPGSPLKERDLCDRLGVSRTPVREALRRLFADGLAEMRPRRSIVVSDYSEEELAEIFELGIVLESFVAGLAAKKAGDDDIAALETILTDMAALLDGPDDDRAVAYARLDQAFHDRIAQAARNPRMARILRQTVNLRLLTNVMHQYRAEDFASSLAQHRMIAKAIASREEEWARSAMSNHIRASRAARAGDSDR